MNADQLIEQHIAEVDQIICDSAVQMAQQLLNAGASVDDLRDLMKPIAQKLAEWRANAVARLHERAARMRAHEARIHVLEVIEAQIERCERGATVH